MKNDTSTYNLDEMLAPKQQEQPQVVEQPVAIQVDWDEVLTEWSYRLPKGYPTVVDGKFTEYEEVKILNEILEERGFDGIKLPEKITAPTSFVLNEGATEDNSEVLCIYFCCAPDAVVEGCKAYLSGLKKSPGKPKKALVIPSGLTAANLGGSGETALKKLIADYNAGKPNIKEFVNAITSGQYIKNEYGTAIKPIQLDRGSVFDKFKSDAVGFIKRTLQIDTEPDKWSPADIFIYNSGAPKKITDLVNQKETTLQDINAIFTEGIAAEAGKIVGISLKQSKAQGGKALSFRKTLTRDANFQLADELTPEQKEERSCLYLGAISVSTAKSGKKPISESDKFGYLAEIAVTKKLTKDPDWAQVKLNAVKTIKKTVSNTLKQFKTKPKLYNKLLALGDNILQQKTQDNAKKAARTFFKEVAIETVDYAGTYDSSVKAFTDNKKKKAEAIYNNAKRDFIKALVDQEYVPKATTSIDEDTPSLRLYKKASCYILGAWFLTGVKTNAMKIPSGFTAIAKQQDPFIAMTAYAISQAGISPYFIKVMGAGGEVSKLSTSATAAYMGGDGLINTQKGKTVRIVDSSGAAGFSVELELEVRKTKGASKKYKVTLDFRFAGEAINIEVSEIH